MVRSVSFFVILMDNGSELKHTREMGFTVDGQSRTKAHYGAPQASWQKLFIEKNHKHILYVLPIRKMPWGKGLPFSSVGV